MLEIDIILLRFDAPMISFGRELVDNYGYIQPWPARSLMTGLLANALGYDHSEAEKLNQLQQRLIYALRCDKPGREFTDFHTVDLGQKHLVNTGWTTRTRPIGRGGASGEATHIRYRHYYADSIYTLALTLKEPSQQPTMDRLQEALRFPARPLFIGRKTCLPAAPIFLERVKDRSLIDALKKANLHQRATKELSQESIYLQAWWDTEDTCPDQSQQSGSRMIPVTDMRDWLNQIHCGRRFIYHGRIKLEGNGK